MPEREKRKRRENGTGTPVWIDFLVACCLPDSELFYVHPWSPWLSVKHKVDTLVYNYDMVVTGFRVRPIAVVAVSVPCAARAPPAAARRIINKINRADAVPV